MLPGRYCSKSRSCATQAVIAVCVFNRQPMVEVPATEHLLLALDLDLASHTGFFMSGDGALVLDLALLFLEFDIEAGLSLGKDGSLFLSHFEIVLHVCLVEVGEAVLPLLELLGHPLVGEHVVHGCDDRDHFMIFLAPQ